MLTAQSQALCWIQFYLFFWKSCPRMSGYICIFESSQLTRFLYLGAYRRLLSGRDQGCAAVCHRYAGPLGTAAAGLGTGDSSFAGCCLMGLMVGPVGVSDLGALGARPSGGSLKIWSPNPSFLREKLGFVGSLLMVCSCAGGTLGAGVCLTFLSQRGIFLAHLLCGNCSASLQISCRELFCV